MTLRAVPVAADVSQQDYRALIALAHAHHCSVEAEVRLAVAEHVRPAPVTGEEGR